MDYKFRTITNIEEVKEAVTLQLEIWGEEVVTNLPQLMAAIHNGGVLMGAFAGQKLIGFCYGFTGYKNHEVYLYSHMSAVSPNYRNLGIGTLLKQAQKEWAEKNDYRKIVWTYDPLEARNAYVNLTKLGGYVRTYLESYYGDMGDRLNQGLPSDRLLLEWEFDRLPDIKNANIASSYPSLIETRHSGSLLHPSIKNKIADNHGYLLPIPADIHSIKAQDIDCAREWRICVRVLLTEAFSRGYKIISMIKNDPSLPAYVLEKDEDKRRGKEW